MKNIFYFFLILLASSCASITGFEDGRTLGDGNHGLMISGNYTYLPDLSDGSIIGESGGAPFAEISYKFGVSDKLDIGGRANTFLNIAANVKYNLIGGHDAGFALATGLELGMFGGLNVWNVQVPLFASFHPSEKLSVYLSPKYIFQTAGTEADGAHYLGSNIGILIGKTHKLGFDLAYYNVGSGGDFAPMLNFGIGGKFFFEGK